MNTNHHPPFQSLKHLPADIAKSLIELPTFVIGPLWDELRRWRLIRLPAPTFDPRNDVTLRRRA